MNKNKKIVFSATIALLIVIFFNIILNNYLDKPKTTIYALKDVVLEGEEITLDMIEKVYIDNIDDSFIITDINEIKAKVALKKIEKGKLLSKEDLIEKSKYNYDGDKFYVTIPINNYENAMAFQITKGDVINLYFTAKASNTEEVLKGYEKVFSSKESEAMLTAKVIEKICIEGTYNEDGIQTKKGEVFNQILIKADAQTAIKLSNLKGQGVFDICLVI